MTVTPNEPVVYLNGDFVPLGEARLPVPDRLYRAFRDSGNHGAPVFD